MRRSLLAIPETFPIAGTFTISRGAKTKAEVVEWLRDQGVEGQCGIGEYFHFAAPVLA